jgi:AcrR family transcriptional regulator
MAVGTKIDGRKEAGGRTRRRLLEAARSLLADRDEDAVALRDITEAARANVAAVSYHFGSKEALCRLAIEEAVAGVVDAQAAELRALDEAATVDDIAAALARPLVAAMTGPPSEARDRLRIAARVATDPPPGMRDSIAAIHARARGELLPLLRRAIPGVSDLELSFRASSVAWIIDCMAAGGLGLDAPEDELERMLVPVIAGALAGGAPAREAGRFVRPHLQPGSLTDA